MAILMRISSIFQHFQKYIKVAFRTMFDYLIERLITKRRITIIIPIIDIFYLFVYFIP